MAARGDGETTEAPPSMPRSKTRRPQPNTSPSDPRQLKQANQRWLQQLDTTRSSKQRLKLRNRLVEANLGLVRQVASRQLRSSTLSYDDLVSVGALGLIRAIDHFEPQRGFCLSTYAVPFIRGAMQHEERDRNQPLKTPRRLRELLQRVHSLQERRQRQGLALLQARELADALGCSCAQLAEAQAVQQALRLRSLDAPAGGLSSSEGLTLLEQLASTAAGAVDGLPSAEHDRQWCWLQQQLRRCGAADRALLLGRLVDNHGWSQLAHDHGLSCQEAEQRCQALLHTLQRAACNWANSIRPMATAAAIAV